MKNYASIFAALFALGLVILFGLAPLNAQAKSVMQYKFEAGDTYSYRMITEQNITMEVMGQEQIQTQQQDFDIVLRTEEVRADGSAVFSYTIERLRISQHINQQGQTQEFSYDSEITPSGYDFSSQIYGLLLEWRFTVVLAPDGKVIEVSGMSELIQKMAETLNVPEDAKEQFIASIEPLVGDDAMKSMMSSGFIAYGKEPVSVGDSWQFTNIPLTEFPIMSVGAYRLIQRENNIATLEVRAEVMPNPDGKPLGLGAYDIAMNIYGTMTGELTLDETTGQIITSHSFTTFTGDMTIRGSGLDITAPIVMEQTQTVEAIANK